MAVETIAGSTLGISAGPPLTFDAAGYAALTFALIGEITDMGSHGGTNSLVTHSPIGTRLVQKLKGVRNEGAKTVQLAIERTNPGQILLNTASKSDATYYFKQLYQGGDIDYFPAKVMSFVKATGGPDSIRAGTVTLELTSSQSGVGIIEVAAV